MKNIRRAEAIQKAPSIKQKEQETQTHSKHTQVTLCIEPEFMENVEEYLDAITPENTSFQILMKQVMLRTVTEITK